jgi:hypothetical protein
MAPADFEAMPKTRVYALAAAFALNYVRHIDPRQRLGHKQEETSYERRI